MLKIAIAGAGFSGAVIARELAMAGMKVDVFESRDHIAGNCHTYRDQQTGVLVHKYGPHIFHTSDEAVWQYICQFDQMMPYQNRVKAIVNDRVYTLPINLLTINQFFGKTFNPKQARDFIASIAESRIAIPQNFEQQALKFVGKALYEAFFQGYTLKQWGIDPTQLPASIFKRLPLRFSYDDNYFAHRYQAIPKHGYTHIVDQLLSHDNITLTLNQHLDVADINAYDHCFWSGPLDAFFNQSEGPLGYRTLDFEEIVSEGDFQGNAVINYCDQAVPWTRISEHKHFTPWETHEKTICFKEYSRECGEGDIPYYPIRLAQQQAVLARYQEKAEKLDSITFVGRLGTYRYLDMDVTIREALDSAHDFIESAASQSRTEAFCVNET